MGQTLTVSQLLNAQPSAYHQAGQAWEKWHNAVSTHAGHLLERVGQHVDKPHWRGLTAALTRHKVGQLHGSASVSAERLSKIKTLLIQAGNDFSDAQEILVKALHEAWGGNLNGFTFHVSDDGTVTVPDKVPAGKKTEAANEASRLQATIQGALRRASTADGGAASLIASLHPVEGGNGGNRGPHVTHALWSGNYGASGPPPHGGGGVAASGQIKTWIEEALRILREQGYDIGNVNVNDVATIIQFESGGNPHAINLWDSNAAAGHPSKGLMQTIDPTFNSYHVPGHGNIYDPVDNIMAGIRYAVGRYGSVSHVPGIVGLHSGSGYRGY